MSIPEGPVHRKKTPGVIALAVALIVIGLLILIPSGLCTSFFGVMGIAEGLQGGHWGSLLFAIELGIIPILFGGLAVWAGIRIFRAK